MLIIARNGRLRGGWLLLTDEDRDRDATRLPAFGNAHDGD